MFSGKVCLSVVKFVEDRLDKLFLFRADEVKKIHDRKAIWTKNSPSITTHFSYALDCSHDWCQGRGELHRQQFILEPVFNLTLTLWNLFSRHFDHRVNRWGLTEEVFTYTHGIVTEFWLTYGLFKLHGNFQMAVFRILSIRFGVFKYSKTSNQGLIPH